MIFRAVFNSSQEEATSANVPRSSASSSVVLPFNAFTSPSLSSMTEPIRETDSFNSFACSSLSFAFWRYDSMLVSSSSSSSRTRPSSRTISSSFSRDASPKSTMACSSVETARSASFIAARKCFTSSSRSSVSCSLWFMRDWYFSSSSLISSVFCWSSSLYSGMLLSPTDFSTWRTRSSGVRARVGVVALFSLLEPFLSILGVSVGPKSPLDGGRGTDDVVRLLDSSKGRCFASSSSATVSRNIEGCCCGCSQSSLGVSNEGKNTFIGFDDN
mmetsp:Transcript_22461/g.46925  ORF Transcript_22461/g.46925 Transcript_22461/m.46925 type:complete len:272 (-) Transcript_22461:1097-1912(-)